MADARHYFDWAATTPPDYPEVDVPFGNPSSKHNEGRKAKSALEDARARCASVLKVAPETLYFTSGGTESNGIILFSNILRKNRGRIISSAAEHLSVREGMETIERIGKPTGRIGVDSNGRVTPELFEKALSKYGDVRFASCMAVNNETGAITDIASLRDVIRKYRELNAPVHFHCDLVQAAGKIPVDITLWEIDSASVSAHKIGGPRGIGLLYLRNPLDVFFSGGGQEKGVRGGTENLYGALALASCLEKREAAFQDEYRNAATRQRKLISSLTETKRCAIIPKERLQNEEGFSPYILQAAFKNIPGEVMARALDDLGFAVSTGSACSSSPGRPVLAAMGVDDHLQVEGIRISQGWSTTDEDIDLLAGAIREVLKFL